VSVLVSSVSAASTSELTDPIAVSMACRDVYVVGSSGGACAGVSLLLPVCAVA